MEKKTNLIDFFLYCTCLNILFIMIWVEYYWEEFAYTKQVHSVKITNTKKIGKLQKNIYH